MLDKLSGDSANVMKDISSFIEQERLKGSRTVKRRTWIAEIANLTAPDEICSTGVFLLSAIERNSMSGIISNIRRAVSTIDINYSLREQYVHSI